MSEKGLMENLMLYGGGGLAVGGMFRYLMQATLMCIFISDFSSGIRRLWCRYGCLARCTCSEAECRIACSHEHISCC